MRFVPSHAASTISSICPAKAYDEQVTRQRHLRVGAPRGRHPAREAAHTIEPQRAVGAVDGAKIMNGGTAYCEIWLRAQNPPAGAKQEVATMYGVQIGTLLGVIKFVIK